MLILEKIILSSKIILQIIWTEKKANVGDKNNADKRFNSSHNPMAKRNNDRNTDRNGNTTLIGEVLINTNSRELKMKNEEEVKHALNSWIALDNIAIQSEKGHIIAEQIIKTLKWVLGVKDE